MYNYHCLNPIAQPAVWICSMRAYQKTDAVDNADAILVRSAAMHDMEFSEHPVKAIARAGAGVNNIPLDAVRRERYCCFQYTGCKRKWCKRAGDWPVCCWHPEMLSVELTG